MEVPLQTWTQLPKGSIADPHAAARSPRGYFPRDPLGEQRRELFASHVREVTNWAALSTKHKTDLEHEMFSDFRAALLAARSLPDGLSGFTMPQMRAVLQFVARKMEHRIWTRRAKECATVLLRESDEWRAAAIAANLMATLECDYQHLVASQKAHQKTAVDPGQAMGKSEAACAILESRDAMALLGYQFPYAGYQKAEGLEALEALSDGIAELKRLSAKCEKGKSATSQEQLDTASRYLGSVEQRDWRKVMTFLQAVYDSGAGGRENRRRISEAVDVLRSYSHSFVKCIAKLSLGISAKARGDVVPATYQGPVLPVVIWIDGNRKAFNTSPLVGEKAIMLVGFEDNEYGNEHTAPKSAMTQICEFIEDDRVSMDVVVMNKKHLFMLPQLENSCKMHNRRVPHVVVVGRSSAKMGEFGGLSRPEVDHVSKWEQATDIAYARLAALHPGAKLRRK